MSVCLIGAVVAFLPVCEKEGAFGAADGAASESRPDAAAKPTADTVAEAAGAPHSEVRGAGGAEAPGHEAAHAGARETTWAWPGVEEGEADSADFSPTRESSVAGGDDVTSPKIADTPLNT